MASATAKGRSRWQAWPAPSTTSNRAVGPMRAAIRSACPRSGGPVLPASRNTGSLVRPAPRAGAIAAPGRRRRPIASWSEPGGAYRSGGLRGRCPVRDSDTNRGWASHHSRNRSVPSCSTPCWARTSSAARRAARWPGVLSKTQLTEPVEGQARGVLLGFRPAGRTACG